ncbi:putative membrane protein [Tamilnaduibacter salinus]|uniref:Putative membrane protein n=1 Tax=Tamilnaduibacter salinus TaxID=1484056 RepID=A0A2U1CT45_9GAMM|nr:DUF2069 domain-containing protein [Tamilnaduibacter salinus]PVY69612.1 putative membrane protein [Tamilnaduibacter salinus]
MLNHPDAQRTRMACQGLYAALIVSLIVTSFWPGPEADVSLALILTVKLLPLLPFIPAVYQGHNRGLIWLSFVLIFYFTQFTVDVWLSQGEVAPVINAALSLLLFSVAMIHLKVNRRTRSQ